MDIDSSERLAMQYLQIPDRNIPSKVIEIKYCEDTRPQYQLSATQEATSNTKASAPSCKETLLHNPFGGVGGTIYNNHTLESFKQLGLDFQRDKKLASEPHVHSVNYAAKLAHTRRALFSSTINPHQGLILGQACNPPDPH